MKRRACQNEHEAISSQCFSVFIPNLACVIITMIWGYLDSFGTAPPSGQEFWKLIFMIITSERFGQKSQDLSFYFCDNIPSWTIPNIPMSAILNFFVKCCFLFFFTNAMVCCNKTQTSVCVIGTMPWRYSKSFGQL